MMAASSGIGVATRPYSPRVFRGRYGPAAMTPDELKAEIAAGDIDTVLLALTDMQGRLQGKRLTRAVVPAIAWPATARRAATTCSRSTSR